MIFCLFLRLKALIGYKIKFEKSSFYEDLDQSRFLSDNIILQQYSDFKNLEKTFLL